MTEFPTHIIYGIRCSSVRPLYYYSKALKGNFIIFFLGIMLVYAFMEIISLPFFIHVFFFGLLILCLFVFFYLFSFLLSYFFFFLVRLLFYCVFVIHAKSKKKKCQTAETKIVASSLMVSGNL